MNDRLVLTRMVEATGGVRHQMRLVAPGEYDPASAVVEVATRDKAEITACRLQTPQGPLWLAVWSLQGAPNSVTVDIVDGAPEVRFAATSHSKALICLSRAEGWEIPTWIDAVAAQVSPKQAAMMWRDVIFQSPAEPIGNLVQETKPQEVVADDAAYVVDTLTALREPYRAALLLQRSRFHRNPVGWVGTRTRASRWQSSRRCMGMSGWSMASPHR
ncbi:MAG: hypothetical protein R3B90_11320 [Planctomycetaceae bacterium]